MYASGARGTVGGMTIRLHAPDGSCLLTIDTPTPGPDSPTVVDPADLPEYVEAIAVVHAPGHRALVTA